MADPYPKSRQLARGERRYRRKIASPKQWAAISIAKHGLCRVCNGDRGAPIQLHHVVARDHFGDDTADNIAPVCGSCHSMLHGMTGTHAEVARRLLASLSDTEYAYMIQRGGEDYPERAYGIRYTR